jgi:hypothetical protein
LSGIPPPGRKNNGNYQNWVELSDRELPRIHNILGRAASYGCEVTANVATESVHLLKLMGGNGSKVVDGRNRNNMLASARDYVDGLLGVKTTVRDLFLEALSKKTHEVPWGEIREHLIDRGHDIGHCRIEEVGASTKYELTFQTGEKISFDGADYHYDQSGRA